MKKKKTKTQLAQERTEAAIIKTNEKIDELGSNTSQLYINLDVMQKQIDMIRNVPSEKRIKYDQLRKIRSNWKQQVDKIKSDFKIAMAKNVGGTVAGVGAGVAVAALGPTAAMGIATTFGVASTGTAISTLSGAAATNAALAWLGGGAAAAGGGGLVSGTAFLALAGPGGWTIGGAALLASIVLFANKKIKLGKEKKEEIEAVLHNVELVSEVNVKMKSLLDKTDKLRSMLNDQYGNCMTYYGKNFIEIADEGQMLLGTLVNNAKSLAATLGETVEE